MNFLSSRESGSRLMFSWYHAFFPGQLRMLKQPNWNLLGLSFCSLCPAEDVDIPVAASMSSLSGTAGKIQVLISLTWSVDIGRRARCCPHAELDHHNLFQIEYWTIFWPSKLCLFILFRRWSVLIETAFDRKASASVNTLQAVQVIFSRELSRSKQCEFGWFDQFGQFDQFSQFIVDFSQQVAVKHFGVVYMLSFRTRGTLHWESLLHVVALPIAFRQNQRQLSENISIQIPWCRLDLSLLLVLSLSRAPRILSGTRNSCSQSDTVKHPVASGLRPSKPNAFRVQFKRVVQLPHSSCMLDWNLVKVLEFRCWSSIRFHQQSFYGWPLSRKKLYLARSCWQVARN